jgi:heat shock protein HslJ
MNRRLAVVLAAVLVAGCGTMDAMQKKEPPPKPFVGTNWHVVLELPILGEPPNFRFGDGLMEGFGGCNRVNARYVQDTVGARAIAIGRIETGRRACEPRTQNAEHRVLEVLQSVSSYSITGDTMTMTGSGGTLKFRAAEEKKP